MTALFVVVVLYAAFIYFISRGSGDAIQLGLAGVWFVMGLWALGSIAWAVLSR